MNFLSDLHENAAIFKGGVKKRRMPPLSAGKKARINLLALGDVGGFLLTGLMLLGGEVVGSVGIYDIKRENIERYEAEMNQVAYPCGIGGFPEIVGLRGEDDLFDCDVFVFCASKEVPAVGSGVADVRMAQFEGNRKIIEYYARLAVSKAFGGIFAVVSDPVDPLCKAAYMASGLEQQQFQGFGLGVMNGRAMYYARREKKFARYIDEGRVFGPHGRDLVVADGISNYNDEISRELTEKVVDENIRIRQAGFKPFMAPALSSGALSLISMLKGEWNYSSRFIGDGYDGAFFGALNRMTENGVEIENPPLPDELYSRIKVAYESVRSIV